MSGGAGGTGGEGELDRALLGRVCRLARLTLEPEEEEQMLADLERILRHVRHLSEAQIDPGSERHPDSQEAAPERWNDLPPDPLQADPASFAPGWREGFFTVPRPPGFEDGAGEDGR